MIITDDVDKIIEKIKSFLTTKERVVIAVPGGRSIKNLFEVMEKSDSTWKNAHVFMVDERLVTIDNDHSNFNLVSKLLFNKLVEQGKMPKENLHPFILNKGVDNYNHELKKCGGKFDIVILGVGEDGHIAGLFPNESINREDESYMIIKNTPKPPNGRMTASKKLILKSQLGIFLFIGEAKEEAFEWFQDKNISVEECPAKIAYEMQDSIILKR